MENTTPNTSDSPKKLDEGELHVAGLNVPAAAPTTPATPTPVAPKPIMQEAPKPIVEFKTVEQPKPIFVESKPAVEAKVASVAPDATMPSAGKSKFKKFLIPAIAAGLVMIAGAGTGAYFFIFKDSGNTTDLHASEDSTNIVPAGDNPAPQTTDNNWTKTTDTTATSDITADTTADTTATDTEAADTTTDTATDATTDTPADVSGTADATADTTTSTPFGTSDTTLDAPDTTTDASTVTPATDTTTQPVKRVKRAQ